MSRVCEFRLPNNETLNVYNIGYLFVIFFFSLQDLQKQIEAHEHVFENLQKSGRQIVQSGNPDSHTLQRKLQDMNQRWVALKIKTSEVR